MADLLHFEKTLWNEGFNRVMGLDEVGRGCLAGPVVAAGVILKEGTELPGVRDSKVLTSEKRDELSILIREKALFWTVQQCSVEEIDKLNILWASIRAMQRCAETEGAEPDYLLVDGNRFTASLTPCQCLVKGDDRSLSIAAASILAKTYRDQLMAELGNKYPEFGWEKNAGYPTRMHKEALIQYGYTELHRQSFRLGTRKKYPDQR